MVKMSKTKQMKNPSFQHFERYFFNLFISHFCKFFGSSYTRNHYQDITKPNQSKSSLYRPFLGVFDPFLGQNTQKPIVIDLKEHSIWKYTYVWPIFHWSRFWTNLFLLDTLLTTCEYMLHYTATQLYSEPWNIHRKLYNHTMLRAYTLHIIKTLYNQISNDAFYNRNFILSNNI